MIHSFPHLIAGTGTQVAPPPASTGEPGYTCSAKYLYNLPIFQSLHFTAFQVMMIHSFPHLIAGTGTQVAPPPASTGEPGYTCSAKYLYNLPIFQSLHFTAFQVMMIHSFPHLIAGTGTQVAPPPASTGEPGYTCSAKHLFNLSNISVIALDCFSSHDDSFFSTSYCKHWCTSGTLSSQTQESCWWEERKR